MVLFTFLVHLACALMMAGMMAFVQVAHYPMLARVGREAFVDYERRYSRLAWLTVFPLMLTEASTAVLLVWYRPQGVSQAQALCGLGLLAVVWLSTATLQWPAHKRLGQGWDEAVHLRLLRTNWIRTVAYALRAAVVLRMAAGTMTP